MGEDVTLKLKVENTEGIQKIVKMQDATQKLHDISVKGQQREKGILQEIEDTLTKLEKARKKAFSYEDIEKYNKKIAETKQNLKEYENAGIQANEKTEKSGNKLLQSVGKWALGFATVTTAIKLFKGIVASTEAATTAFEIAVAEATSGVGFFFKAIASGDWTNFSQGLKDAISGARDFVNEMEVIENRKNEQLILGAEASKKIAELRMGTFDKGIENNNKLIENTKQIIEIQKKDFANQAAIAKDTYETTLKRAATDSGIAKDKLENLVKEYSLNKANIELGEKWKTSFATMREAVDKAKTPEEKDLATNLILKAQFYSELATEWGKVPKEARASLAQLKAQQIALEGQATIGSRRDENLLEQAKNKKENEEKQTNKESFDKKKKWFDDYEKWYLEGLDKLYASQKKLIDDYDKSNIDSLTGVDKLKAIRDFGLKQIKEARTQLEKLGTITAEQDVMFTQLGVNVWQSYMEGLKKGAKETPEQKAAISKALLEGLPTLEGIQKYSGQLQRKGGVPLTSMWQLLGIDPESDEGKAEMDAMKQAADSVKTIIDDMYAKRVEDTQRRRELLDTQISEAQSALESEIELYKSGYASNVALKKKELADLKKQRDEALKKEEAALKQQRTMDTIMQASSLITASANIFKSLSKLGPIGVGAAVIAIGVMLGAFIKAKTEANEAVKGFYKGGWTGDGSGRDSTGERVAGVVHEKEFVVKRGPAHRFRDVLEAINKDDKRMIFNSFNKLKPEIYKGTTVNNVVIENDGSNSRLDKLITENKKLNSKLSNEAIQELSNKTIYRKGNTTRIVRR